jgi:hypothetical protein
MKREPRRSISNKARRRDDEGQRNGWRNDGRGEDGDYDDTEDDDEPSRQVGNSRRASNGVGARVKKERKHELSDGKHRVPPIVNYPSEKTSSKKTSAVIPVSKLSLSEEDAKKIIIQEVRRLRLAMEGLADDKKRLEDKVSN